MLGVVATVLHEVITSAKRTTEELFDADSAAMKRALAAQANLLKKKVETARVAGTVESRNQAEVLNAEKAKELDAMQRSIANGTALANALTREDKLKETIAEVCANVPGKKSRIG